VTQKLSGYIGDGIYLHVPTDICLYIYNVGQYPTMRLMYEPASADTAFSYHGAPGHHELHAMALAGTMSKAELIEAHPELFI